MSQILAPFQLLELNVISAQDLAPVGRNMRTYAVAWVHPDRKLSTKVDTQGHTHPTWNDKFVFRVDEEFLYADTSAIMIEIYALHWFKDIHVGTVRVLVGNLNPPPSKPFHNTRAPLGMRFVALQVRRPSGRPQGILNIGFAVLDSSMRSMPLYTLNPSAVGYRHLMGEKDAYESHNHLSPHVLTAAKPELRRTKSDTSSVLAASEAAVRRQRINAGKTNKTSSSVVSGASGKAGSSVLSGASVKSGKDVNSVLSDSVLTWKVKNGKTSANVSHLQVEPPPPENETNDNGVYNIDNNEVVEVDNHYNKEVLSVNTVSTSEHNTKHDQYPNVTTNTAYYEVVASPKPQFRDSPAVAPQFRNSPMREYKNSPMREYKNSPKPQFKNSPMPEFRNSPKPQFKNSPVTEFRNSPKPQLKNSPMPEFTNSPKPQFRKSPMPEFRNSPKPQFRNSPAVVSKFNPAGGFGGSHRGTPLHPFGKLNGAFEYATPRRSNLGNMGPIVMTESELGPSPSEVAAEMARKPVVDEGNSTVGGWSLDESVEGLQSKLERWRTELPPVIDRGEFSSFPTTSTKTSAKTSTKTSRHTRRHTDGGNGLFSCFSNICGVQCTVVCGGDPKAKKNRRIRSHRRTPSADNTSLL